MAYLKSPCTTSYRLPIEIIFLNCLLFEKIAFLHFGDRQTDKWTDRQTDKQMDYISKSNQHFSSLPILSGCPTYVNFCSDRMHKNLDLGTYGVGLEGPGLGLEG